MILSHPQAVLSFARRLHRLHLFRSFVQLATLWFFIWGAVVLAVRFAGCQHTGWLALGMFGLVPLILTSAIRARSSSAVSPALPPDATPGRCNGKTPTCSKPPFLCPATKPS
jgi:hypothetical protein